MYRVHVVVCSCNVRDGAEGHKESTIDGGVEGEDEENHPTHLVQCDRTMDETLFFIAAACGAPALRYRVMVAAGCVCRVDLLVLLFSWCRWFIFFTSYSASFAFS